MTEKEKIELIMEKEQLNSQQFASAIGIQGSILSHILNDRNRPSYDVLKKILNRFENLSSDWLILDKGPMYRATSHSQAPTLFDFSEEKPSKSEVLPLKTELKNELNFEPIQKKMPVFEQIQEETPKMTPEPPVVVKEIIQTATQRSIKKIIVYYDDQTFQEFNS